MNTSEVQYYKNQYLTGRGVFKHGILKRLLTLDSKKYEQEYDYP